MSPPPPSGGWVVGTPDSSASFGRAGLLWSGFHHPTSPAPASRLKGPLDWSARTQPFLTPKRTRNCPMGSCHGTSGLTTWGLSTWGLSLCLGHSLPPRTGTVAKLFLPPVPGMQLGKDDRIEKGRETNEDVDSRPSLSAAFNVLGPQPRPGVPPGSWWDSEPDLAFIPVN